MAIKFTIREVGTGKIIKEELITTGLGDIKFVQNTVRAMFPDAPLTDNREITQKEK